VTVSVVVPTVGRPSLERLLTALADTELADAALVDAALVEVLLVDDRRHAGGSLRPAVPPSLAGRVSVLPGRGAGPAAARNTGWRAGRGEWVAFLDDDVVPAPDWWARLAADLRVPPDVAGVQGRVVVPLPAGRRPTDWERCTAGLGDARWATADMAYRRSVLASVGGFDERFPRAYREDADLAVRVRGAGHRLTVGQRVVRHPVRPESRWVSLRTQRGNADDALLRRLYGAGWRGLADAPPGRRPRNVAITVAALAAALAGGGAATAPTARARRRFRAAGVAAAGVAAAGVAEFAWARISPGPRTRDEVLTMAATSVLIPPLATGHWVRGWLAHRQARPVSGVNG
jgi:GT2 family glycosyltransferase